MSGVCKDGAPRRAGCGGACTILCLSSSLWAHSSRSLGRGNFSSVSHLQGQCDSQAVSVGTWAHVRAQPTPPWTAGLGVGLRPHQPQP